MYAGGDDSGDLPGIIIVRCKTWNLAISVALAVLLVTACSPGWHPVQLTRAAIISTEELADDMLESDSDSDFGMARTSDAFIGRYDAALNRLLAHTGPFIRTGSSDAEIATQTEADAFETYRQLRAFFPACCFAHASQQFQ